MLQRVIRGGDVTLDELAAIPVSARDADSVADAWHQLMHWVTDADIRAGDPGYVQSQVSQLTDLLGELRSRR